MVPIMVSVTSSITIVSKLSRRWHLRDWPDHCNLVTVINWEPFFQGGTVIGCDFGARFFVEFLVPLRLWVLPLQQQLKPQRNPEAFFRWIFWSELRFEFFAILGAGKKNWYFYMIFLIYYQIYYLNLQYILSTCFYTKMLKNSSGCDPEPGWTTDTSQRRIVWP